MHSPTGDPHSAVLDKADPAYAGQAIYRKSFLTIYDAIAYGFNYPVVWRCRKERLDDLYTANVSARHLDVGVAAGRLLDECRFPVADPEITLMDLNPNSLQAAAERLARYAPRTVRANALEPWPLPPGGFDSVALMNLLHCMPGTIAEKAVALDHAAAVLAPGGVCFGATILGTAAAPSPLARFLLAVGNRDGALSNLDDRAGDLDAALSRSFDEHRVSIVGCVALFTAIRS